MAQALARVYFNDDGIQWELKLKKSSDAKNTFQRHDDRQKSNYFWWRAGAVLPAEKPFSPAYRASAPEEVLISSLYNKER